MKNTKFRAVTVIVLLSLFTTVACSKSVDEVSQKMIEDIDSIGEVTEEDEALIKKLIDRYSTLTDSQKEQVSNYKTLLDAEDKLEQVLASLSESESSTLESIEEETTTAQKDPWDLTGSWCDNEVSNGRPGLAAYIDDSTITVYWVAENTKIRTPFWIGSYSPVVGEENYSWKSNNDFEQQPYCVWASSDETKEFTYNNGILCVPKSNGDTYLKPTDMDFSNGYDYIVEDNPSSKIMAGSIELEVPGSFSLFSKEKDKYSFISSQGFMQIFLQNTTDQNNLGLTEAGFKMIAESGMDKRLEKVLDGTLVEESYKNSENTFKYNGIIQGTYSDTIGKLSVIMVGNPDDNTLVTITTLISDKTDHDYLTELSNMLASAESVPDFYEDTSDVNTDAATVFRSYFSDIKNESLPSSTAFNSKRNLKESYHGFNYEIPQGWFKEETEEYMYYYPPNGIVMLSYNEVANVNDFNDDFVAGVLKGMSSNYTPSADAEIIELDNGLKGFLSKGVFVYEEYKGDTIMLCAANTNGILIMSCLQYDTSDEDYTDDFTRILETLTWTGEEPTKEKTESIPESSASSSTGISPEFKAAMDSYEQFFDEYVNVMNEMANNPSDLTILQKYTEFMGKYAETMQNFEAIEDTDMTPQEEAYYIEVSARINQKLLNALQ